MPYLLCDFQPGAHLIVRSVSGGDMLTVRLMDMGFTPNTPVTVLQSAPSGDPMVVSLRGYTLTIRRAEAMRILVYRDREATQ